MDKDKQIEEIVKLFMNIPKIRFPEGFTYRPYVLAEALYDAGYILSIDEHVTPDETYISVEFYNGELMKCKNSYADLISLLDVDTVEKRIEGLKQESFRLQQEMWFNEVFEKIYGGKYAQSEVL